MKNIQRKQQRGSSLFTGATSSELPQLKKVRVSEEMVAFPNPNSGAGLKKLDEHLLTRYYITGHKASKDDITVYAAFSNPPPSQYVNVSRWYNHIEALLSISGISSQGSGVSIDGLAFITEHADDVLVVDDDGEEAEKEKKAAEERKASLTASTKKKITWESIAMVIIPEDIETNMKELEENVRSIQMEGLHWGASKIVSPGYGIKVLRITASVPYDEEIDVFDELIRNYIDSLGRFRLQYATLYEYLILIKPNDDEADLKKLEETVRSIKESRLFWGASKLVPVGFGIKLLGIECTSVGSLGSQERFETIVKEKIKDHRVHSWQTLSLNRICEANGITEEESDSKDDSADDVDLFGEERAGSSKASSKMKESGRSGLHLKHLVGDNPDIKKAEESLRSCQIEGVVWGASKVVTFGYGFKCLLTVFTVIDDHCFKTVCQRICGIPLNRISKHPKSIC